ncbi:uncharacterized protein SPAPADRAFT_157529 [Spathaspora passalidarum NRRL Y-27907]|uniref:Uncharacterized protein n=1 Tax=Spathaspora passalidarum (strain NRRL Y-27907 / 11-Y1) TaxID=619300 RepID=G3AU85_SPAPN|nr:uncharacterized protein SPAPADRAFT_157529 [Spathaspora passalidarum NRRL Y-27907]EGW30461.1 hypothetical protein SPAPADRAFT_157529 [Spathaspora passalidarum NRRL Y-27907]
MVQNLGFVTNSAWQVLYEEIDTHGIPNSIYIEYANGDPRQGYGVILNTGGISKLDEAQQAVKAWSSGKNYGKFTGSYIYEAESVCYLTYAERKRIVNDPEVGVCNYVRYFEGEDLSESTGLDPETILLYNPHLNFDHFQHGQPICTSIGKLPDLRPVPKPDGTCEQYTVMNGDTCESIAMHFYPLSIDAIETFNQNSLVWESCDDLSVGDTICVSEGTVPRPNSHPMAECGPYAPGAWTTPPECPNNGCCSLAGFCGIDAQYCDPPLCYSNCGYGTLPTVFASSFKNVAYWMDLPFDILHMHASDIDTNRFEIVHYSFARINEDFSISVGSGFKDFLLLSSKKMIAIGGSNMAADASLNQRFKLGVSDEHREELADSIVAFIQEHNLDGVHLDWEYPQTIEEGKNYNLLFKAIKSKMSTKVSIALPPTYFHLKNFPLQEMDENMDYFILMNYDYYGQWNYDTGSGVGCHVDKEETIESIKMIVKSGINTRKLYGGVANYARTFELEDPGCDDFGCLFTGPESGADPGELTLLPGILSENELLSIPEAERTMWYDADSKCDIMVYKNGRNWAAWMGEAERNNLIHWYQSIGLGGTALWAINYELPVD